MTAPDTTGFIGRRKALTLAAGLCAGTVALPARAADPTEKVQIVYATRSGASWPFWIAKQAGLYAKHGLDATLTFGVHPAGIAMLVSGQAQMTNQAIEQALAVAARDPSIAMLGSSLNKGNFALIGQRGMSRVDDLKGKRIGIGRLGDPLYVYTLKLLQKSGLTARDVQWVPTGTDAKARADMLRAGQIDASLMVAPAYFKLEAAGFSVIDLLVNHADIFISTAYVFQKSWLKEHADTALRMIKAQSEAIALFYQDKALAVQAYRAYDPQDEADVQRLYDIYKAKEVLDRVPLLQRAAVASAVANQSADIPALKTFDAAQVVDMGPVRELIAQGYFRGVFGAGVAAEEQRKLAVSF